MTESNPPVPTRRLNFARILEVLRHPKLAFAEIAGETVSSWLTPMLALSISSSLVVIVGGFVKARPSAMGEIQLPPA